jgi:ribosomal-protein-alanine N-acetyltransferase
MGQSKIMLETDRLYMREILPGDEEAMFELDSDPDVHRYLGNKPVKSLDEVRAAINMLRDQYLTNGIARWAVIEKSSGNFIGWAGFKFITEPINGQKGHYDLGYRFIRKYWGKGYASECALALVPYGFNVLKQKTLYAYTAAGNKISKHILEKAGLVFQGTFIEERGECYWFRIDKN